MQILTILVLLASLLGIALFAASEAALGATNRLRLRRLLREQSEENADGISATSDELSGEAQKFVATVSIAASIPLLLVAVVSMELVIAEFGIGFDVGLISLLCAITVTSLFQVAPRVLMAQQGSSHTLWWVHLAQFLVMILRVPVGLLMGLGSLLLRPLGLLKAVRRTHKGKTQNDAEADEEATRDLMEDLVESAQVAGILEAEEKELIESIFTFKDTTVHEVMIPRPNILALSLQSTPEDILKCFQDSGYSRLPVRDGDIDHVAGILHISDVLRFINEKKTNFSPAELMRQPIFIPESQKIDSAFTTLRNARTHLAIVTDEFGGTSGLLTVEDILEELVGEIADEHDRDVEAPLTILDEYSAIADGLLHIEDLKEEWDLSLPTGEFDTIGGFVIEQLGRAPIVGDRIEVSNAVIIVQVVQGRRPHKILLHKKETVGE
jgi:putative hemolysin